MITIPDIVVEAYGKGGVLVFKGMLSDFPPAILAQGAAYAIHKKAQDASGGKDVATEAQAKETAAAVIASLKAGTWAKKNVGPRASTFEAWLPQQAAALAKARSTKEGDALFGKPVEAIATAYLTKDTPNAQAWRAAKRLEWDALQARKDAAGVNLDDILDV